MCQTQPERTRAGSRMLRLTEHLPHPEGKGGQNWQLCLLQTFVFDGESRWAQETLKSSGRERSWPRGCRAGGSRGLYEP